MPEPFDENAMDLDAWRADQERLRREEETARARIDRALEHFGWPTLGSAGGTSALASQALSEPRLFPIEANATADMDAKALDEIAGQLRAFKDGTVDGRGMLYEDFCAAVRSTGREV